MPRRKEKGKHQVESKNSLARTNDNEKSEIIAAFLQKTRNITTGQKLSFKTLSKLAVQMHKTGSLNVQDDSGRTLLIHSVIQGFEKCINFICSLGADVNLKDNDGRTSLMYAFMSKLSFSAHTFCKLIGENPCTQDKEGKSALMYAFENKFHLPLYLVKLLGQAFSVPHPDMKSFFNCDISLETFQGDIQNVADIKGRTHLMYAIMNVPNLEPAMVNILVGNQINACDILGQSALIYSVYYNINLIEVLLNYGANPDIRDYDGRTALMIAMTLKLNVSNSMLKVLIGENINVPDKNGKTVLMYALENSVVYKNIETILSLGANVDVQDNDGKTTMMYAVKSSLPLSLTLLREISSGDVNKQDRLGRTALMYALQYKVSNESLNSLMLLGSDVTIQDSTKCPMNH